MPYFFIIIADKLSLLLNRFLISRLLLAAFMAWLVNTMVPHHHHGTEICFASHHCHETECSQGVSPEGTCQQHDHSDHKEGCVLRLISFLPANQSKSGIYPVQAKDNRSDLQVLVIPDLENPGPGFVGQKWKYYAGSPQAYTNFLIHSCGLRAPPAV